jgi:hypothetical protein
MLSLIVVVTVVAVVNAWGRLVSTERIKLMYNQIPKRYPSFAYFYETESVSVSVGMVHKTPGMTIIHLTIRDPLHRARSRMAQTSTISAHVMKRKSVRREACLHGQSIEEWRDLDVVH